MNNVGIARTADRRVRQSSLDVYKRQKQYKTYIFIVCVYIMFRPVLYYVQQSLTMREGRLLKNLNYLQKFI